MTLPVQFHTVFPITVKIYPSTFILFYIYTDVPVHHYTCSVYFFFFGIKCTMTFQLISGYRPADHPKINLPVYPHASPLPKNKELPVTTSTCVPAHICTRSGPYLFIFILSFRLTANIYPSTFLLLYMSTDVPVYHYTCSVYLFLFGITSTITFQFVYWDTYTQIYPKIKLPVYLHASLLSNHKDLPVTTTTCVHAHRSTLSLPYLFILIISFRQTICTYLSSHLLF